MVDVVGHNDPQKTDTFCDRDDCLPNQGRYISAKQEEDKAMTMVIGETQVSSPPKGRVMFGEIKIW